jgi:hypothetical protein
MSVNYIIRDIVGIAGQARNDEGCHCGLDPQSLEKYLREIDK